MRAYKIDLDTTKGFQEYTAYANTPQQAEINAVALFRRQYPQATVRRALRNGSLTSAAYAKPEGIDWN